MYELLNTVNFNKPPKVSRSMILSWRVTREPHCTVCTGPCDGVTSIPVKSPLSSRLYPDSTKSFIIFTVKIGP